MSTSSRKIAVVTGASSGIGAVYADRLAKLLNVSDPGTFYIPEAKSYTDYPVLED